MAHRGHHAPHLPVLPLVDRDLYIRRSACGKGLHQPHPLRRRRDTVVQFHPLGQSLERLPGRCPGDRREIGFRNVKARMGEVMDKGAVVREKEQPLTLGVEPTHRAQQWLAGKVHKRRDRSRCVGIGECGRNTARLVQRDIVPASGDSRNRPAVERDLLGRGIRADTEFGDNDPVDCHAAFPNPLFRAPARGETGGGENFL